LTFFFLSRSLAGQVQVRNIFVLSPGPVDVLSLFCHLYLLSYSLCTYTVLTPMGHGRQPRCSDSKRHPLGNLFFWLREACSGGEKYGAALISFRGVDRVRAALIRASITSRSVSRQTGTSFSYPKSVLALFVLYIGSVGMMVSLTTETRLVSTPKMASEIPASRLSEAHRALSSTRALSVATKK
jgi:hypothetical protein